MLILQVNQTVYDLTSGGEFLNIAYEVASAVKKQVLPIASGIIGILIITEFLKVIFAEGQVSWLKIFKLVIFFYAFQEYEVLVKAINDLFQSIIDGLSGYSAEAKYTFKDGTTYDLARSVQAEVDEEFFLVTAAKKAMSILQLISQVLLIAMGPLAIMFSFIPGQESIFSGWARNLVHVICWSITFMILDMITASITLAQLQKSLGVIDDKGLKDTYGNFDFWEFLKHPSLLWDLMKIMAESVLVKCMIALGYIFTPWLTGKYFGTTHSSGFVKQMMATAGGVWAGVKLARDTVRGGNKNNNNQQSSQSSSGSNESSGGSGGSKGSPNGSFSGGTSGISSTTGIVVSGFSGKSQSKDGFNKTNKSEN